MKNFSDYTEVFFWDFKRMDNVNYNFEIVETLCRLQKKHRSDLLCKPIILLIVSIIECILFDYLKRISEHKHEKIPKLLLKKINATKQKKKFDILDIILSHIKKHDYLAQRTNEKLYEQLDYLRILRNRVHIQNKDRTLDKDDCKIWTKANLKLSAKCLTRICHYLCTEHPRRGRESVDFADFPKPWG